jgi:hypothetical protein
MKTAKTSLMVLGIALGASGWAGCSSAAEDETASAEGAASTQCQVFDRQTGGIMSRAKFDALVAKGDPIAAKILDGECKQTLTSVMDKLGSEQNCRIGSNGLGSFLISETAAFESAADAAEGGFRTVITKDCEGRGQNGLLFSGSASTGGINETGVEMIGRSTDGVFNYYELNRDGSYTFFGDSKDFVTNGYRCDAATGTCTSNNSAQGKPGTGSKKMCSSCHVSGGLVMKELASPWLHWTSSFPNGSQAVVQANSTVLGNQQAGEDLELNVVRPSFAAYNAKRMLWLGEKGAKELLRPIACTLDVNLDSGLNRASLVAPSPLADFNRLTPDPTTYNTVKGLLGQRLAGVSGKDDTAFPFTYPRKGEIDENYSEKLVEAGVLDKDILAGILAVDFTRPVFSGKRCAVVESLSSSADAAVKAWAQNPNPGNATAAKSEIKKALGPVGNANAAEVSGRVAAFIRTCNTRLTTPATKDTAMRELLTFAATQRKNMKAMRGQNGERVEQLIEDPNTMLVTDDVELGTKEAGKLNLALSPDKCELTER